MNLDIKPYIFIILFFIAGCIGGGGHGSIVGYSYPTTKNRLEEAILAVLDSNKNICRDSLFGNITNGRRDTLSDNYYNDGKNYFTIKVKMKYTENKYTFAFSGDQKYWKNSSSSAIFIVYATDGFGRGGGEKDEDMKDQKLRKGLIDIFKSEFVDKIDKQLGMKDSVVSAYSYQD